MLAALELTPIALREIACLNEENSADHRCQITLCDNSPAWQALGSEYRVIGYLCAAHRGMWYHAFETDRHVILERIGEEGDISEMDRKYPQGSGATQSPAKIRRQLAKQTDSGGCSSEWVLRRAERVIFTLSRHPDCGEDWYNQALAVLNSARLVLAKLEGER